MEVRKLQKGEARIVGMLVDYSTLVRLGFLISWRTTSRITRNGRVGSPLGLAGMSSAPEQQVEEILAVSVSLLAPVF
jgi:hypothetical protein